MNLNKNVYMNEMQHLHVPKRTTSCNRKKGHKMKNIVVTYCWTTAESIEHVKKYKTGEGHRGVPGSDFIVTHL